jgi:ABC-type polar amino acid transport system ATPase subunit
MSESLIEVRGLVKRFRERTILDSIDLLVPAGQTVAIIGPSGGGKSTLLRCINGLSGFEAGTVRVAEHQLEAQPDGRWNCDVRPLRQLMGMVFQDFQLFPHLTALENVTAGPRWVRGQEAADARRQALELLEKVGLVERAGHYPHQLSGGQKQRVAIARALAMRPQGLLCDEITSALDPELKQDVLAVLESLQHEGMTLLMVTHEIGFARRAADRVIVLAEGKIVEDGPAREVIEAPTQARTRSFLEHVLG